MRDILPCRRGSGPRATASEGGMLASPARSCRRLRSPVERVDDARGGVRTDPRYPEQVADAQVGQVAEAAKLSGQSAGPCGPHLRQGQEHLEGLRWQAAGRDGRAPGRGPTRPLHATSAACFPPGLLRRRVPQQPRRLLEVRGLEDGDPESDTQGQHRAPAGARVDPPREVGSITLVAGGPPRRGAGPGRTSGRRPATPPDPRSSSAPRRYGRRWPHLRPTAFGPRPRPIAPAGDPPDPIGTRSRRPRCARARPLLAGAARAPAPVLETAARGGARLPFGVC